MAMIRPETEMKDSGIEWEKIVPIEWNKCRLKDYFEFEKGKNAQIYTKDYIGLHKGYFPVYSGQTENDGVMGEIDTYDYELDECLFSTTVGAKVMTPKVLSGKFSLSQNCLIMRKIRKCVIRFVYYALFPLFDYERTKIPAYMQPSLRIEDLKSYKLYMPLYTEQQAIADYLDETCSKIDEIIAEAKESIVEYKELRESVISNATTRGIKKNRCMKPSGVEWLPEIPSDWNVLSPKVVFAQRKDRAIKGERQLTASQKHGIMYQDDYMKEEGVRIVTVEKDFSILKHVEPDDFVISMRSFQGGLEYSYLRGCISSAYVMLIPNHKYVYSEYYKWFFKSDKYINALQSTSDLIRDGQALRYANFVKLKLFDIPIEEQKEIADYLNKEVPKIDSLISEKESLINDLEAYKKSLIYEVVTGKRRVV